MDSRVEPWNLLFAHNFKFSVKFCGIIVNCAKMVIGPIKQSQSDQNQVTFWLYVVFCLLVFGCQYQCNRLPGKTCLQNDLLCVEWDVKPYTLTLCVICLSYKTVNSFYRNTLLIGFTMRLPVM